MAILACDIGGSSVKYAVVDEVGAILEKSKKPTPETRDGFFALLGEIKQSFVPKYGITGAGFDDDIMRHVDKILADVGIARIRPVVVPAQHGNDANLLGAARNLLDKLSLA
ncbi:hypothetical protein [Selenomonas sp.]|uniref:hypothetical protein n=1 Tax=Selenomonas sp. TaxID=2053611 RepID=UPI002A757B62|nr:hypothetical protein [Selenomonas sp.]MDY3297704.1 hypothetical protein [Selenomonas sp.]MDY4416931.1 hypothetical protein [Selenomonas sp.]